MVKMFNETISNILISYIINKSVRFDDQDTLWISNKIEKLLQKKNEFCNKFNPSIQEETILRKKQCLQNQLRNATDTANKHYYKWISKNKRNHLLVQINIDLF